MWKSRHTTNSANRLPIKLSLSLQNKNKFFADLIGKSRTPLSARVLSQYGASQQEKNRQPCTPWLWVSAQPISLKSFFRGLKSSMLNKTAHRFRLQARARIFLPVEGQGPFILRASLVLPFECETSAVENSVAPVLQGAWRFYGPFHLKSFNLKVATSANHKTLN